MRLASEIASRAALSYLTNFLDSDKQGASTFTEDVQWIFELPPKRVEEPSEQYLTTTVFGAISIYGMLGAKYREMFNEKLPAPGIEPGVEGGIDLHWRFSRYDLLVSYPKEGAGDLEVFGTNYQGDEVTLQGPAVEIDDRHSGVAARPMAISPEIVPLDSETIVLRGIQRSDYDRHGRPLQKGFRPRKKDKGLSLWIDGEKTPAEVREVGCPEGDPPESYGVAENPVRRITDIDSLTVVRAESEGGPGHAEIRCPQSGTDCFRELKIRQYLAKAFEDSWRLPPVL